MKRTDSNVRPPGPCEKVRFCTQRLAGEALADLRLHSARDRIPRRSYHCPRCRGWHLTHWTLRQSIRHFARYKQQRQRSSPT